MALVDQAKAFLPSISSENILFIVTLVSFGIIFLIIAGVVSYIIISRIIFNKKIVIFEKVGKTIEPTKKDRARVIKWGESGDSVFFTKKTKKFLPSPVIQTGRNTYWYYITEDNEFINIGIQDIDALRSDMKIHFLDKEMRYARVALHRNLGERFKKVSFWDKYGGFIAYTFLIIIICVGMWLLFDKFIKISDGINQAMIVTNQVIEKLNQLTANMDKICPSASGIKPAGT